MWILPTVYGGQQQVAPTSPCESRRRSQRLTRLVSPHCKILKPDTRTYGAKTLYNRFLGHVMSLGTPPSPPQGIVLQIDAPQCVNWVEENTLGLGNDFGVRVTISQGQGNNFLGLEYQFLRVRVTKLGLQNFKFAYTQGCGRFTA